MGSRRGRPAHRSSAELLRAFWAFLRDVRSTVAVSLVAVTVAAALRLVPPAATGLAIDHALGHRRMPDFLARIGLPGSPRGLLAGTE